MRLGCHVRFRVFCSLVVSFCLCALSAFADGIKAREKVEVTATPGMKLALIPSGEFQMGSEETAKATADFFEKPFGDGIPPAWIFEHEHPRHRVRITRPFYMGIFHVTRGQFSRFIEESHYRPDSERRSPPGAVGWNSDVRKYLFEARFSWRYNGFKQTDDHPVVNVSWNDAVAFCNWLGKKEGAKYRLPTEAEWEYACRAGTNTRFSTGDDPEKLATVANVADAAFQREFPFQFGGHHTINADDGYVFTSPVGIYKPNAFGLYDMHGNASEWCADWYEAEYYKRSPVNDPKGPETGTRRVSRGGDWMGRPDSARSARRGMREPDNSTVYTGFRVVKEL
jgi:formylglycine-generating enzyme